MNVNYYNVVVKAIKLYSYFNDNFCLYWAHIYTWLHI